MAESEYVFCLLREVPRNKEDKNFWMVEYARRRHRPEDVKVVTSIDQTLKIMLADPKFKEKKLTKSIFLYHHSTGHGTIQGRLKDRDNYHPITPEEAERYRKESPSVVEISKLSDSINKVTFLGCNFGKDSSARSIWKGILGGTKATVVSVDRKVDWGVLWFWVAAVYNKKQYHRTKVVSENDIDTFLGTIRNDKTFSKLKIDWDDYKNKLDKSFGEWLTLHHQRLKASDGKRFSFPISSQLRDVTGDQIVTEMKRFYYDLNGIPVIVISEKTIPPKVWEDGMMENRTKVKKEFEAIFPDDSNWEEHFITDSYIPGVGD
jgi:hypothetical protein